MRNKFVFHKNIFKASDADQRLRNVSLFTHFNFKVGVTQEKLAKLSATTGIGWSEIAFINSGLINFGFSDPKRFRCSKMITK